MQRCHEPCGSRVQAAFRRPWTPPRLPTCAGSASTTRTGTPLAAGARLLTPRDPARRAGTVTARFPGHDGEAIAAALTERGVIVSPRVGSTRFSAHFYNSSDDVGHALATLDEVLR